MDRGKITALGDAMDRRRKLWVLVPTVTAIFVLGVTLAVTLPHSAAAPANVGVRTASSPPTVPLPGQHVSGLAQASVDPHALHWSAGQAYPTVNGHAAPPPAVGPALPASPPPSTGGHWYAGSYFAGTDSVQSWALMEITVPSAATPDTTEFYYVILSIWDNGGSYDQVGFTDDDGVWGLAYSYTTGTCAASYVYNPDYQTLTTGQEYMFAITTDGGGAWLEAYTVSDTGAITQVFALHAATGATDPGLEVEYSYCGDYDYTDYEEVYGTTSYTQPDPYGAPAGFEWFFHMNCYGSDASSCSTWADWGAWHTSNAPPGTHATIVSYKGADEQLNVQNIEQSKGWTSG
jgi:hypothetical protein